MSSAADGGHKETTVQKAVEEASNHILTAATKHSVLAVEISVLRDENELSVVKRGHIREREEYFQGAARPPSQ